MQLERLVHQVEARLFSWLGDEAREEPIDERQLVCAAIRQGKEESTRLSARRDEVVRRIEINTVAASLLPSLIESSVLRGKTAQAIRQSLELEGLRRVLSDDRGELARIEQALWSHGFRLRQLRRRLDERSSTAKGVQ